MPITKYSHKYRKELLIKFEEYIENTEEPSVLDFAVTNNILRENLYGYPEFASALKKCAEKHELSMITELKNSKNPIPYIFLLKAQHKYRENDPVTKDNTNNNNDLFQVTLQGKSANNLIELMTGMVNKQNVINRNKRVKGS